MESLDRWAASGEGRRVSANAVPEEARDAR
jgi:hypothetical protein